MRPDERRLHGVELRRDAVEDSRGGHGGRRDQPAANRARHLFDLGIGADNLLRTEQSESCGCDSA